MKPFNLIFACALLILIACPGFAQRLDYKTFDVIAKSGNVSILVKDKDYRMVVGSLNKPKTVFLLGYSKEHALLKVKRLIRTCENDKYTKDKRQISFCGTALHCSVKNKSGQEHYMFVREDDEVKFALNKDDLLVIEEVLEKHL